MPFVEGQSGNPFGRPPGARNTATVAVEAMLAAAGEDLTRGLIVRAREGDVGALRFCLDRVLRGADRPILFALPRVETGAAARKAVGDIIVATGTGDLTPRQAGDLLRVVERGARAIAAAEAAKQAAERGEPDEMAGWQEAQDYWKAYWREKFEAQYGAPLDLPANTPANCDGAGQGSMGPVATRRANGRDAESAIGPRPRRAEGEVERGAGGDRPIEPVVPDAGAGLQAGANNNTKNNGNNGNNGRTMVPAAAARRFHRDTVDSPRPVKSGWPDAPMTTPGTAPGGVLARWRSGAERATDTAVGLILREGSAGRPVAPAI